MLCYLAPCTTQVWVKLSVQWLVAIGAFVGRLRQYPVDHSVVALLLMGLIGAKCDTSPQLGAYSQTNAACVVLRGLAMFLSWG
jgi:hypothetical protein